MTSATIEQCGDMLSLRQMSRNLLSRPASCPHLPSAQSRRNCHKEASCVIVVWQYPTHRQAWHGDASVVSSPSAPSPAARIGRSANIGLVVRQVCSAVTVRVVHLPAIQTPHARPDVSSRLRLRLGSGSGSGSQLNRSGSEASPNGVLPSLREA